MNTYVKYCPNVFVAKCDKKHEKGEIILVQTKRGDENKCVVHNFLREHQGSFLYSITRADGYNSQERAKKKAEKYSEWAASREAKSDSYFKASQEGRDFLSLAEPIKVGHHSEKRHRALIKRNWDRMDKCVENMKKAEEHAVKAEYWEKKAGEINLSIPESLEYFEKKYHEAVEYHEGVKSGKYEREHAFTLAYAKKGVNEAKKKWDLAKQLWG